MVTKKNKLAITSKKFEKVTPLIILIVADTCLDEKFPEVTTDQREWFCALSDWWVRFQYSNNPRWNREMNNDEGGRDFAYSFVGHWAEAFALDPEGYIRKQREANKDTKDPEWKAGGLLAG